MMSFPENEIVVLDIAGAYARIFCGNQADEASLLKLGFVSENGQMVRPISDVPDRQRLVNSLIDLRALFSSGRDWSPAELVDFYREQGVVTANYRMITWKNPNQYMVIVC